jgi:hypothetical protein
MECAACKAANPDGKRYCGDCGTLLATSEGSREHILAVVKEHLKDRDVVEDDLARRALTKLIDWAKMFGFVAAIPLSVLLLILALLGVTSVADFRTFVSKQRDDVIKSVAAQKIEIEALEKDRQKLRAQYETAATQLKELVKETEGTRNLAGKLTEISKRVEEERIRNRASSALQKFVMPRWTPGANDPELLKPDPQNVKALRDWMSANGLSERSVTTFIIAAGFEEARAKAVKDLRIPVPVD